MMRASNAGHWPDEGTNGAFHPAKDQTPCLQVILRRGDTYRLPGRWFTAVQVFFYMRFGRQLFDNLFKPTLGVQWGSFGSIGAHKRHSSLGYSRAMVLGCDETLRRVSYNTA